MKNVERMYTVTRLAIMAIILIWIIAKISGVILSDWVIRIMGIALIIMIVLVVYSFVLIKKK